MDDATCNCAFCEAERWMAAAHAEPSTPVLAKMALGVMLVDLAQRRTRNRLTRWERVRGTVRAWWMRQVEGARNGLWWLMEEPAVVVAAVVWSSLWLWGSIVWALVVGGWSLRGLALAAGVGSFIANLAGVRRIRDAEEGNDR